MINTKALAPNHSLPLKQVLISQSLKLIIAVLQKISRQKRRVIVQTVGKMILLLSKKTQKRAIDNIQCAMPKLSRKAAKTIAFTAYGNCAFSVAESFWLDTLAPEIFCDEGTLALLQSGQGACIATMHIGCYEAVPLAVAKLAHSSATLTNVPTFIENGLQFYALAGITAINKKSPYALMELIKKAKENCYVSLHCDLWGDEIAVNFFNRKTKAPGGVALIASLARKPLLLGYSVYDQQGNIKVYFETLYENTYGQVSVESGSKKVGKALAPELIMATIYQRFEQIIMQHPQQWYWSYKRWRILK